MSSSLAAQRGVIYFSSLPPNLSPHEIRLHFNKFGSIRRMKFVPYPKKERRPGGPLLPLRYKEGWMEFARAEDAKAAAQHMNSSPVDCKRRRKCYGQLWTVKYLDGFEWGDLAEEREDTRRMRRASVVAARRDEHDINEQYRRLVAQASARRSKAQRREGEEEEETAGGDDDAIAPPPRKRRVEKGDADAVPVAFVAAAEGKKKEKKKEKAAKVSNDDNDALQIKKKEKKNLKRERD